MIDHEYDLEQGRQEALDCEDLILEKGINQLIEKLGQSYNKERFSLKFEDEEIEEEYSKFMHHRTNQLGFICLGQVWLSAILYLSYHIYVLVHDGSNPEFQGVWITTVVMNLAIISQYLLGRKYKYIALQYSNVQLFVLFSCGYQQAISYNKDFQFFDRFLIILGYTASLAYISYCQKTLFFSFVLTYVYLVIRSWYWAQSTFYFVISIVFFLAAFIFLYILARSFQHLERDKFQQKLNQNQLLKMFHNLIRRNHDGIIITQNDEIVFMNSQINQIFNLDSQKDYNPENCELKSDLTEEKNHLIEQFKKTSLEMHSQSQTQDDQCNQFSNIWDYISFRQEASKYAEYLCCDDEKFANGTYFKFEYLPKETLDATEEETTTKQLQVFSQIFLIGSKGLVMTTIRDMSKWLEVEKQKTMSKMKTIAFASAAHEFRNPLNAITQSLQLLEGLVDLSKGGKYFNIALNCSNLMLYLVNDILDFAQIESKKLLLNLQDTSIQAMLEECFSVMSYKAEEKGLELTYEVDRRLPSLIIVDQNRLRQVIINLLSNGIKYTQRGFIKVKVYLVEDQESIRFDVQDTGVGIEEQSQRRLFRAFTKINKNREMNTQGCGLGLSISKLIAQALGGDISFESVYGEGSTFSLIIPFKSQALLQQENDEFLTETDRSLIVKDSSFDRQYEFMSRTFQEESKSNLQLINQNQAQPPVLFMNHRREPTMIDIQDVNNEYMQIPQYFRQSQIEQVEQYLKPQDVRLIYNVQSRNPSLATQYWTENIQYFQTREDDNAEEALICNPFKYCSCSKILLVDDEPFNLIVLEGLLNQLGIFDIDKCFNGQEARQNILDNQQPNFICKEHQQYKLVITDNNMPIMTGIQFAKQIREEQNKEKVCKSLKMVLLSGDYKPLKENENHIFDDVLMKPLKLQELKDIINKYIN
eukprot:403347588